MKDTTKIFLMSFLLLLLLPISVFAQDVVTNQDDKLIDTAREKQKDLKEVQNDSLQYKCSISSSKMDTLETKYRNRFNKHISTYNNLINRINSILDGLEEKNYDVTEAREKTEAFQSKVNASEADFETFSLSFQQARDLLCEDDISGYRDQLKQSRNQLKAMRSNLLKLRSEFNSDVKPSLIALKDQIRDRYEDDENQSE